MKFPRFIAVAAASLAFAASGCLVSETPLLDAQTGRGAPLGDGRYDVCQYEEGDADCTPMRISRDGSGLYTMVVEDDADDVTLARFRRIGRGAWLAQMSGEDDGGYFYLYGERRDEGFTLYLMMCEELPPALREKYVGRGEMEVEDDNFACNVKSRAAATAAAKAYMTMEREAAAARIVYRPAQ